MIRAAFGFAPVCKVERIVRGVSTIIDELDAHADDSLETKEARERRLDDLHRKHEERVEALNSEIADLDKSAEKAARIAHNFRALLGRFDAPATEGGAQ